MEFYSVLIAILLALIATGALFIVGNVSDYFVRRRVFRQFAKLHCGGCQQPFGLEAVQSGRDVSPFEELWVEEEGSVSYGCFPTCRLVVCPHCQRTWDLRHNSQGEKCGPELSMDEPGTRFPAEWRVDPDQIDGLMS